MRNTLKFENVKSNSKVLLLVLITLSMSLVVWAGFTGRSSMVQFFLILALFLSISHLQLMNKNPERRTFYFVLFSVSCLAVLLALGNVIVGI